MFEHNPPVHARPFSVDEHAGDRPEWYPAQSGITLREQAALTAFSAILTGYWTNPGDANTDTIQFDRLARRAFEAADAFMVERNRPYDEQRAADARERERRLNARYLVGDYWPTGDEPAYTARFVFDRRTKTLLQLDYLHEESWRPMTDAAERERLTNSLIVLDPANYGEWDLDAVDELPEWAKDWPSAHGAGNAA